LWPSQSNATLWPDHSERMFPCMAQGRGALPRHRFDGNLPYRSWGEMVSPPYSSLDAAAVLSTNGVSVFDAEGRPLNTRPLELKNDKGEAIRSEGGFLVVTKLVNGKLVTKRVSALK